MRQSGITEQIDIDSIGGVKEAEPLRVRERRGISHG